LKKERTTVWYLDLPSAAPRSGVTVTVTEIEPGYWHSPTNRRFPRRRVKRITVRPTPDGRARRYTDFPVDPADGRHKLRIEVTMERPDDWGGLFLRDYIIRAGPTTSADS
jgi:hypothetical protein